MELAPTVMAVKSEESEKRRVEVVEERGKCVKRRRRQMGLAANDGKEQTVQSSSSTVVKRSSRFRGVSRHRWTGRFEAHLWDKGSWNATQKKKGKQVYLGAYDEEESAARAYDMAALKYWGPSTFTNFPVSDYEKEIQVMQNVTKEEYLASLRRKSSGFSRGVSRYRGVARHHHNGRWEARIGRVFGNKYLYLGTYSTQEEAAAAYDIAAIEYRGINAVTNFDLSVYIRWLRPGGTKTIAQEPTTTKDESSCARAPSPNPLNEQQTEMFMRQNSFTDRSTLACPQNLELFLPPSPRLPSACTKKSNSPTALSLLLQSSIFRELVEKTSNAVDEEAKHGGDKNHRQLQLGGCANAPTSFAIGEETYEGIFYDSSQDPLDLPFICSSNEELVPDLHEEGGYYDRTGQFLWSSVLNTTMNM